MIGSTSISGVIRFGLMLMLACGAAGSRADPIPPGWEAENVKPIGYTSLNKNVVLYESIAVKHAANGRWYLYAGQGDRLTIVDITDATDPKVVGGVDTPAFQVTLHDNLMITSLTQAWTPEHLAAIISGKLPNPAEHPAPVTGDSAAMEDGVLLWDIADPVRPRLLSHWHPHALGTHQNSYPGGKYAYLASSMPGYRGMYILVVLDVSDPQHPKEAGRFSLPGQQADEQPGAFIPAFHGPLSVSPDGKTASAGYAPFILNFDMADPAHPRVVGKLQMIPPFSSVMAQSIHTVLPLWDRQLLVATQEPMKPGCRDHGTYFAAVIDNHNPSEPYLLSTFPRPLPPVGKPYTDFCDKGGRFGPHNLSRVQDSPDVEKTGALIYMTYFNAGLRIYDITDARQPKEVGWFVPPNPTVPAVAQSGRLLVNQTQEVLVDARGNIFVTDSAWGIIVLRYTGAGQTAPTAR